MGKLRLEKTARIIQVQFAAQLKRLIQVTGNPGLPSYCSNLSLIFRQRGASDHCFPSVSSRVATSVAILIRDGHRSLNFCVQVGFFFVHMCICMYWQVHVCICVVHTCSHLYPCAGACMCGDARGHLGCYSSRTVLQKFTFFEHSPGKLNPQRVLEG